MRAAINCAICGVLVPVPAGRQKYCRECAAEMQRRQALEIAKRKRAEARQEAEVKRLCVLCGKVVEKPRGAQKICDSCRGDIKSRPVANKKQMGAQPSPERPWDLRGKDLTRVGVEAAALGLTYGKYVSYIESGFIDRHCLQEGIVDGPGFVKKAWEEFLKEKKEKLRMCQERIKARGPIASSRGAWD